MVPSGPLSGVLLTTRGALDFVSKRHCHRGRLGLQITGKAKARLLSALARLNSENAMVPISRHWLEGSQQHSLNEPAKQQSSLLARACGQSWRLVNKKTDKRVQEATELEVNNSGQFLSSGIECGLQKDLREPRYWKDRAREASVAQHAQK